MSPAPPERDGPSGPQHRFFLPILAGATWRDRWIACLGALISIAATYFVCRLGLGDFNRGATAHLPLLVAPMGASAVLLFAVPASPLAQPWSIIGGNTLSALVGITVAHWVPDPALAAGLAVALAIALMSLARCLHPPGGAAALLAVLGGPQVAAAGYMFAFNPIALNAVMLVLLGFGFHKMLRHNYPHVPAAAVANTHGTSDKQPAARIGFNAADIDGALGDLGEAFDIDRGDLDRLLHQVELRALERSHGNLRCADIMSRDIIRTQPGGQIAAARTLLLDHHLRMLPVIDAVGHVVGSVGLRELLRPGAVIADVMSPAWTIQQDRPVIELIAPLTDGKTHAAVIVDTERRLVGLVTQTDLLATLGRVPAAG